jgi:RNA-directed DNA polymerase
MYRVDVRLSRLALNHGITYTRYVDDLALSGGLRLLALRRLIERIVQEEGFKINPEKFRTMLSGSRQVITGIVVNEKLNLPREQRDAIRRMVAEVTSRRRRPKEAIDSVRGKLSWLSTVNPGKAVRLRVRTGIARFDASNYRHP